MDLQGVIISVIGSVVAVMLGFMLFIIKTVVDEWRSEHSRNKNAISDLREMVQRLLDGQHRQEEAHARVEVLVTRHGTLIEAIHDSLTKLDKRIDSLRDGQHEIEAELRQAIGALEGRQDITEERVGKLEDVITSFMADPGGPGQGGR